MSQAGDFDPFLSFHNDPPPLQADDGPHRPVSCLSAASALCSLALMRGRGSG